MSNESEIRDEVLSGDELHQELFDGLSTEEIYDMISRALN